MNNKKNILVIGADGQLGMEFKVLENKYPEYNFTFASKENFSITGSTSSEPQGFQKYFGYGKADYCINCAAYTAVDKAESEKEFAFEVNAWAVRELAIVCKKNNAQFIHISTDYVFDGNAFAPYKETDPTNPESIYGQSKLEGEKEAIANNDQLIVIRTSWVYSSYGKNFVKTMLRLMHEKESIGVVKDQVGSPTYAADLAAAILEIISANKENTAGIYHYCNEGIISWYDFALEIKRLINSKCVVNPIPTTAYPTPAKRPKYSVLDTTKVRETFGVAIPFWKDSLEKCIRLLNKKL